MKTNLMRMLGVSRGIEKISLAAMGMLLLVLMSSCGKENTTTSSVSSTTTSSTTDPLSNATVIQLQTVACTVSGARTRVDFYTTTGQSGTNSTTVQGPFTAGALSGPEYRYYIGVSAFKDILIVRKVLNGTTIVGYNVTALFCGANNSYNNTPIIGSGVSLSNFQVTSMGIIMYEKSNCPTGSIDYAYTGINSSTYNYNPIETLFYPYCY